MDDFWAMIEEEDTDEFETEGTEFFDCLFHETIENHASTMMNVDFEVVRLTCKMDLPDFAQLIGVSTETVCAWQKREEPIPAPVQRLMYLLVLNPTLILHLCEAGERGIWN